MTFQSKGLWMSKDVGCFTDGDLTYDSTSRIESKRLHQWSMDSGETQLFQNKKQAVELPSSSSFAGIQPTTHSSWSDISGISSLPSQINDRLFQIDASSNVYSERHVPLVNAVNMNMARYPFGNASLFGLSMCQPLDDPKLGINYGGIRKVKVSEVRDSENLLPKSMGPPYSREASVTPTSHGYSKVDDCGISMGLMYSREEDNVITLGESYSRVDGSLISMDQSFNKGDSNTMAIGHNLKDDSTTTSTAVTFNKSGSIMSMAENFSKGNTSVISMGNPGKMDDCVNSISQTFNKDSSVSVSSNCYRGTVGVISLTQSNSKGENLTLSSGHSFDKVGSNIISFGGLHDDADASGRLSCSYDLLMGQASGQSCSTLNQKDMVFSNANAVTGTAQILSPGAESAPKKKEDPKSSKKIPPNNFPSNVRSLLSTGILDEVPVKYVAWSREKELHGIIKGSGYLCGCQLCNFSKVINAYEFERHAGCKTKHPNNHIYFENGKTIYGIVQELRSTPQNILFDTIQTITGSPINQKSFRLWKESFLAATRELQRIYGKDEMYHSL